MNSDIWINSLNEYINLIIITKKPDGNVTDYIKGKKMQKFSNSLTPHDFYKSQVSMAVKRCQAPRLSTCVQSLEPTCCQLSCDLQTHTVKHVSRCAHK